MALKRISVMIDESLLSELDEYAKSLHISRSASLSVIVSEWLRQKQSLVVAADLLSLFQNVNPDDAAKRLASAMPDKYSFNESN